MPQGEIDGRRPFKKTPRVSSHLYEGLCTPQEVDEQ